MGTTDIEGLEAAERLDPVEGVVAILSRAAMTGTHKLGLLLALLDLAPESVKSDRRVSKECLASRIVEIHWTHGRPYGHGDNGDPTKLRQTSSRKKRGDGSFAEDATVMLEIEKLREFLRSKGSSLGDRPLEVVQRRSEGVDWHGEWLDAFKKSLKDVEKGSLEESCQTAARTFRKLEAVLVRTRRTSWYPIPRGCSRGP